MQIPDPRWEIIAISVGMFRAGMNYSALLSGGRSVVIVVDVLGLRATAA
ncbi:hypothetical protein FOXYSP1_18532 [Fusarium oxysporum f. sp. phaseoli]